MFFVLGIGQRPEKVLEATGSANVLGRTGIFTGKAKGELESVGCAELGFKDDGVLPAIAEVCVGPLTPKMLIDINNCRVLPFDVDEYLLL